MCVYFVLTIWNVVCAFKVRDVSFVDPLKRSLSAASQSFKFGSMTDENDLNHATGNCHCENTMSDGVDGKHSTKCVVLDQQNAVNKSGSDVVVESKDDSKLLLGKMKNERLSASFAAFIVCL